MSKFQVGDVVWLKSGGPCMVVNEAGTTHLGKGKVKCQWFTKIDEMREAEFFEDLLVATPQAPTASGTG